MTLSDVIKKAENIGGWVQRINDTTWCVSTVGYKCMNLIQCEEFFIKSGLFQYDTSCLQDFDRISGRTTTKFKLKKS